MPDVELELTGPQYTTLGQEFERRFSLAEFDQLLKTRLNLNRESIAVADSYSSIVFRVIDDANRKGWVARLVEAARTERPGNAVFLEYARFLKSAPGNMPDRAELERIITSTNTHLDIAQFRRRLSEVEARVCRIDLDDAGLGTGFLVGPDLVLTCYHVVEGVVGDSEVASNLSCLFDYKVREDDSTVINNGTRINVVALELLSPYDRADLMDDVSVPDPDNLDFALLRLDAGLGDEPMGRVAVSVSSPLRGWFTLPAHSHHLAVDSPLFIVQHPRVGPMKLALDTEGVIGLAKNGLRLRYRTNTEPGSSGSPCFDQHWNLIALHHSGDRRVDPNWNEGIPIHLITAYINRNSTGTPRK